MPSIALLPDALRIVPDGFDPTVAHSPANTIFSTDYSGLGKLAQVSQFTVTTSVVTIPLVGAPFASAPAVRIFLQYQANRNVAANENHAAIINGENLVDNLVYVSGTRQTLAVPVHAFSDKNNVYLDPLFYRGTENTASAGGPYVGWAFIYPLGALRAAPGGAKRSLFGFRDGDPGLWIANAGQDPFTEAHDNLFFSMEYPVATIVQTGVVDTSSLSVGQYIDVTIPDLGFKPVLEVRTGGSVGVWRHVNNTTIRFYRNFISGDPGQVYTYIVFATEMVGAP